jgi:iron(III) transport system ATP-binding protein
VSAPVPLVTLTNVAKRYHRRQAPAVRGLSFTLGQGEILALLGPSGCGKTTTLRLIAGFETPDAGVITIGGRTVADATPGRTVLVPPEERGVGIVFQDYALFPHLTVEENVAFGLHRLARAARETRVREVLRLVGLDALTGRYPHELSGGQQQRVALARALAPAPALLLLDEPFSNLDADLRNQVRAEVANLLRSTGTAAIFVTHDQEEAFTIADRVGVLAAGRLEQLARPEVIYHEPATTFVAAFVGVADFLPGAVTREGVVTEIGTFPNADGRPLGDRVAVMVRPDDVTFSVSDHGAAVVRERSFRGSETVYGLELPSGRRVRSSQPSAADVAVGLRVDVSVHALHVVMFDAAAERRGSEDGGGSSSTV